MKTPEQYEAARAEKINHLRERYNESNGYGEPVPLLVLQDEMRIGPTWLREGLEYMGVEIDENDGEPVAWVTKRIGL